MKKGLLITSVLSIAMLASITAGATYALFMVEDETNVAITAGEVIASAVVDQASLRTFSLGEEQVSGFANGGSATFDADSNLALSLMTPGDAAEFTVRIDNSSTVRVKYRISVLAEGELSAGLVTKALVNGVEHTLDGKPTEYITIAAGEDIPDVPVRVELPETAGNEWQGKSASISVKVEVIQANANVVDTWDGTASYEWFTADPEAEEFYLDSAEALAGFAALLDNADPVVASDGEGEMVLPDWTTKEFYLTSDVDLLKLNDAGDPIAFDPIGSYRFDKIFSGLFDGQGHTIYNLNQNTWELNNGYHYNDCGLGLFGAIENATIRNLTIENVGISGESALCGTIAAVAGDNCTFENITVKNAKVADYQYYAGGLVGWASGKQTYSNITVEEDCVIGSQWGDFDNSIGGIIGGVSGSAEITIKDSTVKCRIDAVSDAVSAYQWFAYRRAGMLVGNSGKSETIDGRTVAVCPQLTCENVTVIYNDWANYTYCEFAGTNYPYVRVQEGTSVDAYSNVRYGHPTDAAGNVVVDDNHVHNEGEDHHKLVTFDQLYGGGQGVYGNPVHEGVTVVYNNK